MTHGTDARGADPITGSRRVDPFRWIIENPGTVDVIAFSSAAALILLFSLGTGAIDWWTLFTVPMFVAASVCRVRPGLGVALIGSLALLHVLVGFPVVLGDVLTFYAMFCAAAYGSARVHAAGVAAGFLGVLVQSFIWGWIVGAGAYGSVPQALITVAGLLVVGSITIIAVWALANLQRARVRQLALTRDRAEQAARDREQRTALAVADERARIAREMHDVVAHSLSVIIAQADGGRFVASQQPEKAVDVLGTIGESGRAALADMRSLLGVLREEDETSFGPQPGPDQLPELVERVRAAGLSVDLQIEGELADLPQALGMSLFRLVQESLTNVLKHAGPRARAAVRVLRGTQRVEVSIIDDGRGSDPGSDGPGHGITGMRERMSIFGGSLQAGPLPGHGYRVLATVPVDPTSAEGRTVDDAPPRMTASADAPTGQPSTGPLPEQHAIRSPYSAPPPRSPYDPHTPSPGSEGSPR